MKLKKMVVCITKKDIRNFLKLQDKINISDIFINDYLRLIGNVQVFGMNINIETELSFSKVEYNNIYLNIKSFKLLKMNIVNQISKKIFNYVINAFTDIEGVTFEGNDFKLEVATLVNKYYKEQKFIDLNRVQVIDVSIVDKEVEVEFGGIDIDTEIIRKEYGKNEAPYVEAEIVSDLV
ncbi:hypothetical protein [Clostridium sp.]|uniref:hypothetical protein n=1 Tax=Clostridium sp. TaxID=1506 RepID=UPI0026081C00|nr:hypothetical protein [Clostridium sp.]